MLLGQALLDQQVIDRNDQLMGKVDGVIVELRGSEPPRLATLVIGGGAAAHRIHRGWGAWVIRWRRRWGPRTVEPLEIPWSKVLRIGVEVKVDIDSEFTPALAWEHWVRDKIIGRIPGA
jgi:hypothetical protein